MLPRDLQLFDEQRFITQLRENPSNIAVFKQTLEHARLVLDQRFLDNQDIEQIIRSRAWLIDQILRFAWRQFAWSCGDHPSCTLSLNAVGGYGRAELHPYSDIDVLILLEHEQHQTLKEPISQFITFLWDIGLDIGHSVRTIRECTEEARNDITVITNLIESRTLSGNTELLCRLKTCISPEYMWDSRAFFLAKRKEQQERHFKFNDTEYNLEPNVKSSPGSLRDIQTVLWVAHRHFGMTHLETLSNPGFLTESEYRLLSKAREFLWRVRYALHMLAGREEDRLLFEYQRKIADLFGYNDTDAKQAIEQFMQKYYRVVMGITELCELINQYLEEIILRNPDDEKVEELNRRFQIRDGYIEARNINVFKHSPFAILEIFVLLAQHPEIKGVRAKTIRLLRDSRQLIDENFRQDLRNTSLFIELFKCREGIHMNLRRMNRYGILGRYLPEFGKIVGQMQHDLYHIYTVDAHTLNLVKHLRKLRHADYAEKFSLASAIMERLSKPELIYLAGLYHDIGKGRGGNHSELGAIDAEAFCMRHQLPSWDTRLIVWLVKNHLIMSATAQRKDITDPQEIHNFALLVGDQTRLDYLYVLTVADINATNPTLWNSWRAQLLRQLYSETRRALRRGLENPLEPEELIQTRQSTALSLLAAEGIAVTDINRLWGHLGDDYFLRHSAGDIAWHTQAILEHGDMRAPLVAVRESSQRGFDGGTQIFIYAPNRNDFFAATVATLDQLNLSTQDARIITSNKFTIETYIVLDLDGERIGDNPERCQRIQTELTNVLKDVDYPSIIQRRVPRQLKHFAFTPMITIHNDAQRPHTVIEVIAPDRPGFLARVGNIFLDFDLSLVSAKIITLGERVEDVFFITDKDGQPLSDPKVCQELQEAMVAQLSTEGKGSPSSIHLI